MRWDVLPENMGPTMSSTRPSCVLGGYACFVCGCLSKVVAPCVPVVLVSATLVEKG